MHDDLRSEKARRINCLRHWSRTVSSINAKDRRATASGSAIEAGAVAASHIGLGPALTPFLEALVAEVKETCSIGAITGNSITLLQRVEAESVLRVDLKVGTRLPLHTSAIGVC